MGLKAAQIANYSPCEAKEKSWLLSYHIHLVRHIITETVTMNRPQSLSAATGYVDNSTRVIYCSNLVSPNKNLHSDLALIKAQHSHSSPKLGTPRLWLAYMVTNIVTMHRVELYSGHCVQYMYSHLDPRWEPSSCPQDNCS